MPRGRVSGPVARMSAPALRVRMFRSVCPRISAARSLCSAAVIGGKGNPGGGGHGGGGGGAGATVDPGALANSCVHDLARWSKRARSSMYILEASGFSGSSGFCFSSRLQKPKSTPRALFAGLQLDLRMSIHTTPPGLPTLQWKIALSTESCGAANGYGTGVVGKRRSQRNTPPSYGVPAGPRMRTFQDSSDVGFGCTLTLSGGSCTRLSSSSCRRRFVRAGIADGGVGILSFFSSVR